MIKEIEQIEMPEWLTKDVFTFNLKDLLKDSLYYPCAHFDGKPVTHLMGNIYSFIYVDFAVTREEFCSELDTHGFDGYHILYSESIQKEMLTLNGKDTYFPLYPDSEEMYRMGFSKQFIKKPFCEWIIFERNDDKDDSYNPKRFSLLFLCSDGAAAYQELYLKNEMAPKVLAIIQPGHGFGLNYTNYYDRDKVFARTIYYQKDNLPKYLLEGGYGGYESKLPGWHEYSEGIWSMSNYFTGMKLWKRV